MPSTLKHYRLVRLIGQGGMGLVFEGADQRDGSRVALKVLHPHLAIADPTFVERFEREAHVAALLRSPHTVHLLDFGTQDGRHFIVMEYIEGRSLADLVHAGPLDPQQALRIAAEVARALEEAEARGVVHRDIKPENVLLDGDGRVKVTDFGIARSASFGTATVTGAFIGTPAYAAPEQIDGLADHRSDIYSLGVTLYTMLTGRPPYQGASPLATMLQHRQSPFPAAALGHLPEPVQNVVRRATEKHPLDRYQTGSEFAGAIERARQAFSRQGVAAEATAAPPALQQTGPRSESLPSTAVLTPGAHPGGSISAGRASPVGPTLVTKAVPVGSRRRAPVRYFFAAGIVAVMAAATTVGLALSVAGGDGKPSTTPSPSAAETSPTIAASTSTSVPTAVDAPLPSVTPPIAVSRLGSGKRAQVVLSVNLTQDPTSAGSTRVLKQLQPGERLIIATNTPPSSTFVITEGLLFWRAVIEGTQTVGWVPEVTTEGSLRYLDLVP